jgi:hypothetical protein
MTADHMLLQARMEPDDGAAWDEGDVDNMIRAKAEQEWDEGHRDVSEWMTDDLDHVKEVVRAAIRWNATPHGQQPHAAADLSDAIELLRSRYIDSRVECASISERTQIEINLSEEPEAF